MKKAIFTSEPVEVQGVEGAKPYVPIAVKGARDAYAASLHLLFKHVADFHVTVIEILAEKYKIPAEEMLEVVKEDPRYQTNIAAPVVNTMGYFEAEDVEKLTQKVADMSMQPADAKEPPKKKARKVLKPV